MKNVTAFLVAMACVYNAHALQTGNPCAAPSVGMTLTVSTGNALAGEAIRVDVTLANDGDEPVLLPVAFSNFAVVIESARSTRKVTVPRYTADATTIPVDEVPLRPSSRYSVSLPVPLNDVTAPPGTGWFGAPGRYTLRAVFDVPCADAKPQRWRGRAVSNAVEIHIRPVTGAQNAKYLSDLRTCLATSDTCDSVEISNFYQITRDSDAAEMLIRLLEKTPHASWLLDAIIFQSRPGDVARLKAVAASVPERDRSLRKEILTAASKLTAHLARSVDSD